MSQRLVRTRYRGLPVVVRLGWDRQLYGFFCVVTAVDSQGDDHVYSNLDDWALLDTCGISPDLAYFEGVLQRLGITVPAAMLAAARQDALDNVGNRVVWYGEDGEPLAQPPLGR